jgi:hypothetical protein
MRNEYDVQVEKFLKDTNTTFKVKYFDYGPYFNNDKESREIYKITLRNPRGGSYTFKFGQSIANQGQEPTPYSVLACLQKYDVGSFEDFCKEFGYVEDSRKAEKIYKGVLKEYNAVNRLFTEDEIKVLAEIN